MCLKINWSIKTLCHKPSMVVTRSGLWALKATESPHHLHSVGFFVWGSGGLSKRYFYGSWKKHWKIRFYLIYIEIKQLGVGHNVKKMKTTRQQQNLKQQRVIFAWSYKYIQYCKSYFKNQNYIIGQLRYFGNNLSRTSKQAEIYFMNCILIK